MTQIVGWGTPDVREWPQTSSHQNETDYTAVIGHLFAAVDDSGFGILRSE